MGVSSELLSRFARALASESSPELPRRLCSAFAQVTGSEGAAIALGSVPAARTLLAVTDALTEQIEDLQDMVGEGPSLQVMRGDGPAVLDTVAAGSESWPALASAISQHAAIAGVGALYAFAMRPEQEVLGVVTARLSVGASFTVALDEAQALANVVGVAVVGALGSGEAGRERWLDRDRTAQAAGMVVAQLRISVTDAMAVLRAHAYAQDLPVSEISNQVVDRSLRFTPPLEDES